MNNTTPTNYTSPSPSYPDNGNTDGSAHSSTGHFSAFFFFLMAAYLGYISNSDEPSPPSPSPPPLPLRTQTNNNNQVQENNNSARALSQGLNDDILVTFPTFVYSEAAIVELGLADAKSSGCSICLADYKGRDFIKLLPCRHLFHVKCIDTWLKLHPTCPVCRKSHRL